MQKPYIAFSILAFAMGLAWWSVPSGSGPTVPGAVLPLAQGKPKAKAAIGIKAASKAAAGPSTAAPQAMNATMPVLGVRQRCEVVFALGNPTERTAAFAKLLATTTDPAALKAIIDTFNELYSVGRRYETEWNLLWHTLGHRDPAGTMALIESCGTETSWYKGAIGRVLSEWGSTQPEASMRWLDANKTLSGDDFDKAAIGLINGYAARDLDAATAYAMKVFSPGAQGSDDLYLLLSRNALQQRGVDGLIAWFQAQPNGPSKVGLFNAVANRLQEVAPARKRSWLEAEARQPYRNDLTYRQLVQDIANQDPRVGMDYVNRMPRALDGGMPGVGAAAFAWLEKDLAEFTAYYHTLPAGELKTNILKAVNNSLSDPKLPAGKRIVATQFMQAVKR
jgi:hypothetical protein